jgi:hypothetical protein
VSVLSEYGTRRVGVRPLSLSFRLRFQGAALVFSSVAGLCPGRELVTSGGLIGVQMASGRAEWSCVCVLGPAPVGLRYAPQIFDFQSRFAGVVL